MRLPRYTGWYIFKILSVVLLFVVCIDLVVSIYNRYNVIVEQSDTSSAVGSTVEGLTLPYKGRTVPMPECLLFSPGVVGPADVRMEILPMKQIEKLYGNVRMGGYYQPSNCTERSSAAIIVPYRERPEHLRIFLLNLHAFLQKQQLEYAIFIIQQSEKELFNRGKVIESKYEFVNAEGKFVCELMNIGFKLASEMRPWDCYIFHDVDLIPEDDRNLYKCNVHKPRHLAVLQEKQDYKLSYAEYFGGVTAMTADQMNKINGFSNRYWGWGAEDDDAYMRVIMSWQQLSRPPPQIGRYRASPHDDDPGSPKSKARVEKLKNAYCRWRIDGLNDLVYKTVHAKLEPLYTHIVADLWKTLADDVANLKCPQQS